MIDLKSKFLDITSKLNNNIPVTMESNIKNDLELDSLGIAELLLAYEDEFDIFLDPGADEIRDSTTVGDVFKIVQSLVKVKS